MKKLSLASLLLLTACVTINIYFPAAAAEKAADKIIQGIQDTAVPVNKKEEEPQTRLPNWQLTFYQWVDGALNVVITPAHAEEANLSIDSTEIRRLRASMKARFGSLKGFYNKGFVGLKKDGLIATKDVASVPLKERNKVKKLVTAENKDRESLYHAIADANGHPDWYKNIKSTFAKRWLSNAKSGWWYETSKGSWKKK